MNELQIINIDGVECYEKDGTAYLRLETVARGLGFTRIAASGNEVVRWETVRKYLIELGVPTSHTAILIGDLAKILKQNGIETGQKRLFSWLRENGYQIKRKGTDWNMPTQKSMEMGLFEVKESTVNNPDGSVRINRTTKVTGKGQEGR